MSSWGYVHRRDASLNSFTTFDDDLGWDAFEGTNSDGIVPDGEAPPQELRKGKRSSRGRPPPSKFVPRDQRANRSKSNLTEEWDSVRPPSLSPPLSMGNASNSGGLVPSDEGFEGGSGAVTDGGGVLKAEDELGMDTSSFAGLDNLAANDVGGLPPGKRLAGAGSMDFGYEGLGDMDVWFKGPDTSAVPWETTGRNSLQKSESKVEDPDELVAQVLNEDTPSPERGDFDSGKGDFDSGKSTLTSDESQSNALYPFQNGGRDWENSAAGGAENFQQESGVVDLKPNVRGGLLSTDQKEKIQLRLTAEKDLVKRQIHQQLVKQQQEREDQHRLQQEQEQQLIRRQEVERQFLYMQVQKQQQAAQAQASLSVPEASQEDLEKIALELSAAEPRPFPDASSLPSEMAMSAPSTSGSEEPNLAQDDASIKRARRQAVARRLEQTGKRVPKSPSFSNLSSKGSYSPQQSFHAPPPPSPVALPGGALQRSPPLESAPPPSIRPPPLVLPNDPAMFPSASGGGPSPLIPTPQTANGFPGGSYMPAKYPRQQPNLPPGPPSFGQAMYYSPQMGGAQPTYLSPPGTGQMGWGGSALVDPSLQVPPEDDSAEANVFRELEGAMRNLDVSMRLTLRDSLFRLADSAGHRAVSSAAARASGSTADTNQSGSSTPGNATATQAEKVTQMIDRAVANLLYHKQITAKQEELAAPPPQNQFLVGGQQQAYGAYSNLGGAHQQVAPPTMLSPLGGGQNTVMGPPPAREWYWHDTGQGGSQMVSNAQLALPPRTNQAAVNRSQKSTKPSFASRYKRGKASQKPVSKAQLPAGKSSVEPAVNPDAKAAAALFGPPKSNGEARLASGGARSLPKARGGKGQKHEAGGERDLQGSPKLARSAETGRSGVSSVSVKDERRAVPGAMR